MKAKRISFLLQLVIWSLFLGIPFIENPEHFSRHGAIWHFIKRHALYITFFYLNYFYFIPVLLKKKGLTSYVTAVLASIVVVFFVASFVDGWLVHREFKPAMFMGFVPVIQMYALSTTFRLVLDYINQLKSQKELEGQNRIAEVNFLRSQINPHFLFNTLNNINALIRLRPEYAEKSIGSLSDLMRYMLNSSKLEKVELSKELEYINNYIELQKLRLPKEFNLKYETSIKNDLVLIEPLLLIGFIENTFKHGISGQDTDFIWIEITSDSKQLTLTTRNTIHSVVNNKDIVSGVGLENTKKRLNLCYYRRYIIEKQIQNNIFEIQLKLEL